MVLREWMVTHEWMVKPTPQTEWIERRGLLIWIAEVFTSIGAGLYLVSVIFNNLWGMAAAVFVIVFLKLFPHLFYLGKPTRFWRIFPPFSNAWKTSWIARGILFTGLLCAFALVHIAVAYSFPEIGWNIFFKSAGIILALLAGVYSAFVLSYCRSVPFWNSALLPMIFLFAAITDGLAFVMAIGLGDIGVNISLVERISSIILIVNIIIIISYLWNATYTSKTSKYSAELLLKGDLAIHFWGGVVGAGIVVPAILSVTGLIIDEMSATMIIAAVISHTAGTFALKYCLLKAGFHNPMLPATTSSYH